MSSLKGALLPELLLTLACAAIWMIFSKSCYSSFVTSNVMSRISAILVRMEQFQLVEGDRHGEGDSSGDDEPL